MDPCSEAVAGVRLRVRRLIVGCLSVACCVACDVPGGDTVEPWSDLGLAIGMEREAVDATVSADAASFVQCGPPGAISLAVPTDDYPEGTLKSVSTSLRREGGDRLLERWLENAPKNVECFAFSRRMRAGHLAVWKLGADRVWLADYGSTELDARQRNFGWGRPGEVPHLGREDVELEAVDCDWVARLTS